MAAAIIFLMIFLLFVGMPVGFALGTAGMIGLFHSGGWATVGGVLLTTPYRTAASYTFTAIPMFVLMAEYISRSNVVEDVFDAASKWLERLPGGMAIATVFACAGMGAMCGSSAASSATMAKVCVPELRKYGYSESLSTGVVAASGTLAIMIPPSIGFIMYGIITQTSIGRLLIAGIFPGIISALLYVLGILIWNKVLPGVMPPPTRLFAWRERWRSLRTLWAFAILIFIVIGSIYSGLATPTEAASFGAFAALAITLVMRRLGLKDIYKAAGATIQTTTMIFTIMIGAIIFGYYLAITQTTQDLIKFVGALDVPFWTIMGCLVIFYLILGCIMDGAAILFVTLPLTFPLATSLGYDPIWYGVVVMKTMEMGVITPPVGMNAYIISATANIPLEKVFRGTGMFLVIDCVHLAILLAFPAISTWLPSKVMG